MDEIKPSVYEFGPFRLDVAGRHLLRGTRRVPLPVRTFDILLLLVQQRGRLVMKEELMSAVWPDQFVEENNLTVRVSALRRALGEKPGEHKYLETVPRRGYRFIASVQELPAEGGKELGDKLVGRTSRKSMSGQTKPVMYLAVLPFINENGDPNTEYLSEGIAEGIIDSLSLLPRLKVMAWATTYRYKGQELDPYRAGWELGVQAVLVVRLLLDSDTLIVSAELMGVDDQSHIWGARYQRRLSDLTSLPEEITSEISKSLRLRLVGEETKSLRRRYSYNSDAYLLYLQGLYFWNKRSVPGITKAVEYFQKAI
jgi:DNA-binding winged helix-turn-helix (wHTH) protein